MRVKVEDKVAEWLHGEIELQQAIEIARVANVVKAHRPCIERIGCRRHVATKEMVEEGRVSVLGYGFKSTS